ncbi:MAG: hypothetical protein ACW98K_09790 [Candidatus Kariarchaeaceae archaeon]
MLITLQKESLYYCEQCKHQRIIRVLVDNHVKRVENSSNGLARYSDVHSCKDGLPGVNNLHVDGNYAARTVEHQELPPARKESKFSIPGVPTVSTKVYTKLEVGTTRAADNFRLIIFDEWLRTIINIGDVDENNELPISTINSDLGGIILKYYPCDVEFTSNVEKWLSIFVNSLELLPPTRFGLVISTLNYVIELIEDVAGDFDVKLLRTILASHEIYFQAVDDPNRFDRLAVELSSKYSEKEASLMMELLAHLELHPTLPLQYYSKTFKKDLDYLIYLFLILENEGLINVDRPGIIDTSYEDAV